MSNEYGDNGILIASLQRSTEQLEAENAALRAEVEQLKSELASERQDYLDREHMLHSERDTWQNKISELTRQRDLAVSAATKARNQAQQCALVCSKHLDVYRALLNMIDVTDDALAAIKESEATK